MSGYAARMSRAGKSFIREILKVTASPEIISFAGGLPNPATFAVDAIREASDKVLREDGRSALQYGVTEGYALLREFIAARYAAKGIPARPEDILITSGSQQGLDLIGKVFLDKGDEVVIEQPGYLGAIQALSMYEPEFLPVPLENDGINIEMLEKTLKEHTPKLFYAVPNFQNPSGITYSAEKRKLAAALLNDCGAVFVEDDPYGELRFMGEPAPSMRAYLDRDCILLGSFSKIFAPAMRLGWVFAPQSIMEQLIVAKQASDLHTNFFSQRVLYEYLRANDLDRHIEDIRALYKKQRSCMVEAIEQYFPKNINFTRPEGGMFIWAELPEGMSALKVFDAAIARNVAFVPGDPFYVKLQNAGTLRLNYTNSDDEAIQTGIRRLSEAILSLYGQSPGTLLE